jgi:predicted dienelactone hydrolase
MLSHGRGSTGLSYAWFAQALASHGYIVAAPYHWRANNYDATVAYLANKLSQRPVDVSLDIDFLLSDPAWSKYIETWGATKERMEGGLWLDPACGIAQRREGSKCMTAKI